MAATTKTLNIEVAVIGGGPGGYAAAFRAADRGKKVAIIDDRPAPGGVCLNVGCIPSKALLHAAGLLAETRAAKNWGLDFGEPKINLEALRGWKNNVVGKLTGGILQLCKSRGVQILQGRAVFMDSERLRIEDCATEMVVFERAVVATGSSPIIPKNLSIKSSRVMDSTGALELADIPARLLIVGGGYIGLELGTVYAELGSRVTFVEMTDGLLPGADRDMVRPVSARIKEIAEAVHLETKVLSLADEKSGLRAVMEKTVEGKTEKFEAVFDRALIAAGRRPNTSGLGLENTKAKLSAKGFIEVNAQRRTADERIYAIGDAAGEPMLAHKATREGLVAGDALAGIATAFDPAAIPAVVFTDPEIAWCGLTESEAKKSGRAVKVGRFPWGASGRSLTLDRKDGMTKIVCDAESGLVLGVGIVGPGAGELIAEGTLAIEMGATAEDLAATIHPHPTLSETIMESAELIFGSATHVHKRA